ncbi:unnamed protein product, partial [Scytosiphon promiscuus]
DWASEGLARLRVGSRAARFAVAAGARRGRLQPGVRFPTPRSSSSGQVRGLPRTPRYEELRRSVEDAQDVSAERLAAKFMSALAVVVERSNGQPQRRRRLAGGKKTPNASAVAAAPAPAADATATAARAAATQAPRSAGGRR